MNRLWVIVLFGLVLTAQAAMTVRDPFYVAALTPNPALITFPTNGLILHWKLDETGTSDPRVDSISTNTLYPIGSVDYTNGILGNAAKFNTTSGILSRTNDVAHLDGSVTIGFWLIWTNMHDTYSMAKRAADGSAASWLVTMYNSVPDGGYDFGWSAYTDKGSNYTIVLRPGTVYIDTWQLAFLTFDTSSGVFTAEIHDTNHAWVVNAGSFVAYTNAANIGDFIKTNNYPVQVGGLIQAGWTAYQHSGWIDSVSIWNRVLSDAEKQRVFNSGRGRGP